VKLDNLGPLDAIFNMLRTDHDLGSGCSYKVPIEEAKPAK
jgi:hypothetical protein